MKILDDSVRPPRLLSRWWISGILVFVLFSAWSQAGAQPPQDDPGRCGGSGPVSICAEQSFPNQGHPCRLTVLDDGLPVEGAEIRVTYRPNSQVATSRLVGRTDAGGQVSWVPEDAGMATLRAEGQGIDPVDLTVSIRFQSPPWLGIAILILAAMILFGGNGYSFAKTFGRSGGNA